MPVSFAADEAGVTRLAYGQLAERVEFADLASVLVRTTVDGPFECDVFFVLASRQGTSVVVPQDAMPATLLASLQRLDGFDNEALIEAMLSTDDAEFVVWNRR